MIDVDDKTTMYLYDYKRRKRAAQRTLNSTTIGDLTRVGNSWAWIPSDRNYFMIQGDADAQPRRVNLPSRFKNIFWVHGSPDGKRIALAGFSQPDEDSLVVAVLTVPDFQQRMSYVTFAEGAGTSWMNDGSLMIAINDTPESETLWRWSEGQPPRRIGSIPRLISNAVTATVSGDGKWAFVVTRDDRRDIWMSRVVR
jgi:hypothetical protein